MGVLDRTINVGISISEKITAWLRSKRTEEQEQEQEPEASCYDTLTPKTINDESMQEYFKALKFALLRNEVRNIAVTGNYGAGKSTVISSFIKYHSNADDKFINVSLAGFDMTEKVEDPEKNKEPEKRPFLQQEIELSILQQILYKEEPSTFPESKIERIQNKNLKHSLSAYLNFLKISLPMATLFGLLFFRKVYDFIGLPPGWYEHIEKFVNNHPNSFNTSKLIVILALVLLSSYFIISFASKIGIFDKKIKLNKISLLGGELETDGNKQSSLLNNCLDEIVYFFARSKYTNVVFEDLDRLGAPEIFVKLREINKVINNNRAKEKPVKFIYAVRDDLFTGAEVKSKFFDFIIPVVSFIDSRNSFALLKGIMNFNKEYERYLKMLAAYITDMRSMKNIVNEYHVFSKVVDSNEEIRLLSIVFYKNIFSTDYILSDKKTGLLYLIVRDFRTRSLQLEYFEYITQKLVDLKSEIKKIDKDAGSSLKDIRSEIISDIIPQHLWGAVELYITENYSDISIDIHKIVESEEAFVNAFSGDGLYIGHGSNKITIDVNSKRDEYLERKEILSKCNLDNNNKLHGECNVLEEKIKSKNTLPLKELIKLIGRKNFGTFCEGYFNEISKHDYVSDSQFKLLVSDMRNGGFDALYLLLSNGLILQDYMSYRSIFHKGAMSENDNDFIKAIGLDLSCEESNEKYFIDDVAKVIEELIDQNKIYSEGALHCQLITNLVSSNSLYMNGIITAMFQNTDEKIMSVFLSLYGRFDTREMFDNFITKALSNTGYLDKALKIVTERKNEKYSRDIAVSIVSNTSHKFSKNKNEYQKCIYELGIHIISLVDESKSENFMNNLRMSAVKYDKLFIPSTCVEIYCLRCIASYDLYKITKRNVGVAISCMLNGNISPGNVRKKPWTYALESNSIDVVNYFIDNINIFVKDVLISSRESAEYIRYILGVPTLSHESRILIIENMKFKFSSLSDLNVDTSFLMGDDTVSYHDLFYFYDHVTPGWTLLLEYISDSCYEKALNKYITKYSKKFGVCESGKCDEYYDALYGKIICNNNLDDATYKNILSSIDIVNSKLDTDLSSINFERLVRMKKIQLDEVLYRNYVTLFDITKYDLSETLVALFSQFQDIFMADTEFYLQWSDSEEFFEIVSNKLMHSELFEVEEKVNLVLYYASYYLECEDVNLPKDVLTRTLPLTADKEFRVKLFIKLISTGYLNEECFIRFCQLIDEEDLKAVFIQRTQATVTAIDEDNVLAILESLKEANFIKEYEHRDDGKFFISIKPRFISDSEMEND
ncbi:DNA-binding protein [Morganella morganii]|uniref:YobI family P-loop NTPase n=1 Tax=Morganella morganii TaxID=582 RepID=UPI001BDA96C9|nr:DNA-binding protein [Morganella morganii]MBT0385563.1 DNA-binding protein [Morganella morganii subsp. morganii]